MKKSILNLLAGAALLGAAAPAAAAFDWANPTIEVVLSQADLQTITGEALYQVRGVGILPGGNIVAINQNSGITQGVYSFDVSGAPATGTEIVTLAALQAARGNTDNYASNSFRVATDGNIYGSFFTGADTIMRINTGTAARVFQGDGTGSIAVSPDGTTLYVGRVLSFGAADNEVVSVPANATDGTLTTLAGSAAIQTASGGTGVNVAVIDVLPSGNVLAYDEANFGGTDQFLEINAGTGAVSIFDDFSDALFKPATQAPGLTSIAIDSAGVVFGFDEFNEGSGAVDDALVIRDTDGTWTRIGGDTIRAAIGLAAGTIEIKTMGVLRDGSTVTLVAGNDEQHSILRFTWVDGATSVNDWNLY
jgi:hypothetical protein